MSITRLMRDAAVTDVRRSGRGTRTRRGPADDDPGADDNTLGKLTKYIPTEAIALYVAILPFLVREDVPLEAQDYTTRWFLAAGVGVLAVVFAVGVYRRAILDRGGAFRWPPRMTATVVLAYTAWVVAIPGSPVNDFGWYSPALGAVVALVVSAVIAAGQLWFGEPEE
jgi:uncharacterized membrane protein YbhN (UPF0104 family)